MRVLHTRQWALKGRQAGSTARTYSAGSLRLVIIGDAHGQYGPEDEAALSFLEPDAAIFLGDFGEERVDIVETISAGVTPRAVILGNHDAW